MIFSTNEREALRLMARADPNWPELRRMGIEAMDWGLLRRLAGEHGLSGLVAWRCVDARLDGICPELVRDDCRKELAWLELQRKVWLEAAGEVLTDVGKAGLPYVFMGSPLSYSRFGEEFFPREVTKLDIYYPDSAREQAVSLRAEQARASRPTRYIDARAEAEQAPGGASWSVRWGSIPDETFRALRRVEASVYGVSAFVPSPSALLCLWTAKAHVAVAAEDPATLESIARIADAYRGADIDATLEHLASYAGCFSWYRYPVPKGTLADRWPQGIAGPVARWGWRVAEALYPGTFPEEFLARADDISARAWPPVHRYIWPAEHELLSAIYIWPEKPDLESVLFEHSDRTLEALCESGLLIEVKS